MILQRYYNKINETSLRGATAEKNYYGFKYMVLFLLIFLLAVNLSLSAQTASDTTEKAPEFNFISVENLAFAVGERLTFGIYYQFIRVGSATMSIEDTVVISGRKCIHIKTTARSASFFDTFYKVRDEIHSYVDAEYYHALKFEKKLQEGSYYHDLTLIYDYNKGKLYGKSIRYNDEKKSSVREKKEFQTELVQPLFDVLASFYFVRLNKLEPGMPVTVVSNDNEEVYPLLVYVQKKDKVKVAAGRFRALQVVPKLKGEAVFKQKGSIIIWLTDDEYKIPVKVESELAFGSIYVELEKIEGHKPHLPSQSK